MQISSAQSLPEYRFSVDRRLFAEISAIPGMDRAVKALSSLSEPLAQRRGTMYDVAVGWDQKPEIHAIGRDCAAKLGIAVPRIFLHESAEMNAWTLATDDECPSIFLTTELVQRLDLEELRAVIGHECGYIHCLHGSYSILAEFGLNLADAKIVAGAIGVASVVARRVPGHFRAIAAAVPIIVSALQKGPKLLLATWSRCAEVTCDRTGTICAGDPTIMARALAKLASRGIKDFNIDAYVQQTESVKGTLVRLMELFDSHPLTHKRIEAVRLFAQSDVFRAWCPTARHDLRVHGPVRAILDVDRDCDALISVWTGHSDATNARPFHFAKFRLPFLKSSGTSTDRP